MSSSVSCMSAARARISGAVGWATGGACFSSTGWPVLAVVRTGTARLRRALWWEAGLGPGEHAARRGPPAALLREHLRGRDLAVDREMRAARRQEGAVHAERPAHRARRHGEHEGLDQVPPAEDDLVVSRHDALLDRAE